MSSGLHAAEFRSVTQLSISDAVASQVINQTNKGNPIEQLTSPGQMAGTGNDTSAGEVSDKTNFTREDLDPVLNNLFAAREQLLRDNLLGTLDALNAAGRDLYRLDIVLKTAGDVPSDIRLAPLQRQVEAARDSLLKYNTTNTLERLNRADTQFVKLAQNFEREDTGIGISTGR